MGLRRAFARVKENHGCAGADGVDLGVFEAELEARLECIQVAVESESYFAWPLRRIEVERHPGSSEKRTLLVPSVADRVLQTAVAAWLEPILEPEFEECSFAYRRGRSVRMAVERVHALFHKGFTWLVDADIDDFFDSVDRELILSRLHPLVQDETVLRLVRLWLDYTVWDGLHLLRPSQGLPQGAVVSPMLANLCLDTLDERLLADGFQLVRYADDFVILARSRKAAERAYELTDDTLTELRLRLHAGKTRIVRYSEGFKFLGVIFLKELLLQPFRSGRRRLKLLSVAPPMPETFFPAGERRPLRRYRVC
jgi:group II intron reverse transcriptase/maturase